MWYDKIHIMTSNGWSEIHADELREIIASNPPEAQAEGWQGPWKCEICGTILSIEIQRLHYKPNGIDCSGTFHPYDRRKSDEAGLRKVFGNLLRSHSWYTAREYERDTTYNDQSPGYKEEKAALDWFVDKYGDDALHSAIYPPAGEKKWRCTKCGLDTGKLDEIGKMHQHASPSGWYWCGPIVEQGEEKKGCGAPPHPCGLPPEMAIGYHDILEGEDEQLGYGDAAEQADSIKPDDYEGKEK